MNERIDPDDPKGASSESSPRSRAERHAYREFMAPGDLPDGARVAEAEARLADALERELGVTIASEGPRIAPAPGRERVRRGWLDALLSPSLRPVWGLAAVVVVAGGVWLAATSRHESEPVLRGPATTTSPGRLTLTVTTEGRADRSLRLEWTAAPEADRYAIVFLSPELAEVTRVTDLRATHLDLGPDMLPPGLSPGSALLVRVLALRGEDEVARSSSVAVTLP